MKRGVRRNNFDTNIRSLQSYKKKDDQILGDKKRKPSKIEERLRMRKLNFNNMKIIKSPDSEVIKSSNTNADDNSNSCDSSTDKTNSCSSTSSEYCNPYKIRDSKQRVDLLEVQASDRLPINYILSKKSKGSSKINGEKIGSFFLGRSRNFKARAKSAPCTPLFQIKYAKDNLNRINFGDGKNLSDYKNDGSNCVGLTSAKTNHQTLIINDEIINEQPIGNPALISVMTKSIDKIKETCKSRKCGQGIDNEEYDETSIHRQKSNLNFATNETGSSNIINEIERNSTPQETEIPSKLSANLELRVNECSTEKCEELNANIKDEETNLKSRNDNASEKCCNCKVEKNRVNISSPRNFTDNEEETVDRDNILHRPILDVDFIGDQRTEFLCRSKNLQLQMNRTEDCRSHGCNNICKNETNDFGRVQISNTDLKCCKKSTCCVNSIRNYIRPSSAAMKETKRGTNRYFDQKRVCNCKIDAANFNCCSNFESELKIRCGEEDHSAISIAEYDIPSLRIVQSPKIVTKFSSSTKTRPSCIRSCDYCNRTAAKCYTKVFSPRSKSTPRRVSFCLPSLIPEEEESCSGLVEDNKTVDNCLKICKRGGTGYSGVRVSYMNSEELKNDGFSNSVLQGSKKKPGRISRCNFHSHCGCNFHHKPRSPRFNFCKKIINNHQYIVREDLNDIEEQNKAELPKDSESKTSVTSAKEWAVDYIADNLNYFNNVSFPKETRQAMNVLLQSRTGNPTTQIIHKGEISHESIPEIKPHRQQPSIIREVKLSKKPDFGIFDSERHKAMHVAKYAQALAMFQRTCDPPQELGYRNSCKKKEHNIVRKGMSDGGN